MQSALVTEILNGGHDDILDELEEAARSRAKAVAVTQSASLKPGDTVMLTGHLRPKYLIGMTGTVAQFGSTKAKLAVDLGQNGTRYEGVVKVPRVCVEAVDA